MTPTPASNQTKAEKVNSSTAVTSKTTEEPLDHHQSTEKENRNEGDGSKTTENPNLKAEVRRPVELAPEIEPSDSHLNTFPEELRQRVIKWMPSSAQLTTIKLVCRRLNVSAKALEDAFLGAVTSLRFDLPYRAFSDGCVDSGVGGGGGHHHGNNQQQQQQHHFLDAADGEFFHPNDGPTVGSCLGVGGGNTAFRVHRGLLVKLAAGDDGQQCEALGRRPQPSLNTFEPRARDRYSKSAVLLRRRGRSRLESRIPDLFQDSDYQQQQQLTTTKVIAASEPAYDVVHQVVNLQQQLTAQSVEHLGYHRQPSAAFIAACRRMANVRQLTLVNAAPLFGGMAAAMAVQPRRQPLTLAQLWPALEELRLVGRLTVPLSRDAAAAAVEPLFGEAADGFTAEEWLTAVATTAHRQEVFRQLRHLRRLRTLSTTLLLASRLADCPLSLPVLRRLEELNVRVKLRRSPSPPAAMERAGLDRALQLLVWRRATAAAAAAVVEEEEEARMLLRFDLLLPDRNRGSETMTDGDVDHLVQRILEAEEGGGGGGGGGRLRRLGLRVDDNALDCRGRLLFRSAAVRSCLHRLSFRQPITLEALAWTTATFKALTYLDFAVEQWYSDAKEAKAAAKRTVNDENAQPPLAPHPPPPPLFQPENFFHRFMQLFRQPPPPEEEEDPAAVFSIAGPSVDSVSPFSFTFSSLISRLRELPLLRELKFSLLQPASVRSLVDDDADFRWTATVLSRSALTLPTVRRVQASFKADYHHLHLLKRVFPAAERITFVLPVAALTLSPEWKKVMCRSGQSCSVCDRVEALVEAALKEKATTVIIPVHPDPWAQGGVLTAKDDGDDEDDYEEIGHLGFYEGGPELLL